MTAPGTVAQVTRTRSIDSVIAVRFVGAAGPARRKRDLGSEGSIAFVAHWQAPRYHSE
jgi:hypothetical protein